MKFHNFIVLLLLQLLSTSINSANGERLKSQCVAKNTININLQEWWRFLLQQWHRFAR